MTEPTRRPTLSRTRRVAVLGAAALLPLLLAAEARAETCARPTTTLDVQATVADARTAFAARDHVPLAAAAVDGRQALACIVEPVDGGLAEALHLAVGLWVSVEQGDQAAVPYLAAAHVQRGRGELGLALSEAEQALVERVRPQLEAWEDAGAERLPPPLRGQLSLDGDDRDHVLPSQAPVVLQRVAGDAVLASHYVVPGSEIPRYTRRRPVLAWTSGGLALASGGLLAGAALTRAELYASREEPLTTEQVDAIQARNHAMIIASGATGALATVGLTALLLSYRW